MNPRTTLVFVKGEDKTIELSSCFYSSEYNKYVVQYNSTKGQRYYYDTGNIQILNNPKEIEPSTVRVKYHGVEIANIESICVFTGVVTNYWHIALSNGRGKTYPENTLSFEYSCLNSKKAQDCLAYLKRLSEINDLKNDNGEGLLSKKYDKLNFVPKSVALASYLNPDENTPKTRQNSFTIYPFGGNASQFKAVASAMSNQISVIQGPPGTGKTQTILNIIANLLISKKTVQVVSSNNSATDNVLEKLSSDEIGLGFLAAPLGKAENKEVFIEKQSGAFPDMSLWKSDAETLLNLRREINSLVESLGSVFDKQERLAKARCELDALQTEYTHFSQYYNETTGSLDSEILFLFAKSNSILKFLSDFCLYTESHNTISFWFKLRCALVYGIWKWRIYKLDVDHIRKFLQNQFYILKRNELMFEIERLEGLLKIANASEKMERLTKLSMTYLRAKLFERYGDRNERKVFTSDDLWKNSETVLQEYPIVLSTTFSSSSSLRNVTYDYLIMDEASQVDIATGALALSNSKNAVIVGDLRQLPNVVKGEEARRYDVAFEAFCLPEGYSYTDNSFLKSICRVLPKVPQVLLREHYRCHPKIIEFCNQKFYNGELIIMTKDNGEKDALTLVKTTEGNHRREHVNLRQIEVVCQEVLPRLVGEKYSQVGIISPYRNNASELSKLFPDSEIEIDTVHKFQGREKDTIILTTVDDVVTSFSDDPYLLNVAISRAKKRLYLVVSGNEQPADSNISDLTSYIEYNRFETIESNIYSVFDLLYQQYTDVRIEYLSRHRRISEFDSENLMYATIVDYLENSQQNYLGIVCHVPLSSLIRNSHLLSEEECRYVENGAHVDFLIYNRISKKPLLAIEVDGVSFHQVGTRQGNNDTMKNEIMDKYKLKLLRLPTNGSNEIKKIEKALSSNY